MTRTVRVEDDDRGADAERRVGSVVAGRYRLQRVLGAGGMGVVYEAQHAFTHQRVAVKLVHRELSASPRTESRFVREARSTASVGHPGIVAVLDGGRDDDGTLYLVEELLAGQDLARAVAARRPEPPELAALALEVLDALAAAHAKGLVHRDIKPENIFVLPEGSARRAKLLDFGIARWLEAHEEAALAQTGTERTQTGSVVGTPYFMSPEQARGDRVDARTDLWSLGAVMFYALTGRHPVEADNYNALIIRVATQTPPPVRSLRPDAPEALAAVVDRALAPDLASRWGSARAMADALRAFVDPPAAPPPPAAVPLSERVTAPPPPAAPPSPPPARRAPTFVAGLLAGAVLGALGARVTATRPSPPSPRVAHTAPPPPPVAPPTPPVTPPPDVAPPAVAVAPDVPVAVDAGRAVVRPPRPPAGPRVTDPVRVYE